MLSFVLCDSVRCCRSCHVVTTSLHHWALLPACRVAEVPLAEHHPVEGGGELEADHHAGLLAGHVQPRDLRHVGGAALPAQAPVHPPTLAERLDLTQRMLKQGDMRGLTLCRSRTWIVCRSKRIDGSVHFMLSPLQPSKR